MGGEGDRGSTPPRLLLHRAALRRAARIRQINTFCFEELRRLLDEELAVDPEAAQYHE